MRNMTPKVIKALCTIDNVELSVVLGRYTKCDEYVRTFSADNIKIYKNPISMVEIMRNCDIAVTAAGSMIYELAALGMPTITITQADNQLLIADYLNKNNLMKNIGDWQNVDFDYLKNEAIVLLSNYDRRKAEAEKLVKTVDKNGAVSVVKNVLTYQ